MRPMNLPGVTIVPGVGKYVSLIHAEDHSAAETAKTVRSDALKGREKR